MNVLREVDPDGVMLRRKRKMKWRLYKSNVGLFNYQSSIFFYLFMFQCMQGPNHIWHLDGYDKLSPFGFAIHACIDGLDVHIKFNQSFVY